MILSQRKCPCCDGNEFVEGQLNRSVFRPRGAWTLWGLAYRAADTHPVKAAVCTTCGYVHHYIDGPDLTEIQKGARGSVAGLR